MTIKPTLHERALQLAKDLPSIAAIRQRLIHEGYDAVDQHLNPPHFRLSLKRAMREARQQSTDR